MPAETLKEQVARLQARLEEFNVSPNPDGSFTVAGQRLSATGFASAKKKAKQELDAAKKAAKKEAGAAETTRQQAAQKQTQAAERETAQFKKQQDARDEIKLLQQRNQVDALLATGQQVPKELAGVAGGVGGGSPEERNARIAERNAKIAELSAGLPKEQPVQPTAPTTAATAPRVAPTTGMEGLKARGKVAGGFGATAPKTKVKPSTKPGGGGAEPSGPGTTEVTPAAPAEDSWDKVSAKFREMFPQYAWLTEIDPAKYGDVQTVIRDAYKNRSWESETGLTRFKAQWENTSFYKELASTGKRRDVIKLVGDVGFDTTTLNSFLVKAMNLGWQGDTLRFETYKEVFRKDDQGQYVNPTAVTRVQKSNDYLTVSNIGKAFFNTVSDPTVQSVLTGEMNQEDVVRQQRELAKTKYGHLSTLIDQGLTLQDIGDSFKSQAAQLLEKDPNTIDMSQADYEVALNFGDPGQKRLMTNGEWQRLLKTDKRYGWNDTNNAKAEARRLSDNIVAAFGRVI